MVPVTHRWRSAVTVVTNPAEGARILAMRPWRSTTGEDSGRPENDPGMDDLARLDSTDPGVFPVLFDHYWDPVFRYCYQELGSWEDAEDAAQQTMIEVARALHRFASGRDGSLRSWVFAIAHAKAIDVRRRRARRPSDPLPDNPPWIVSPLLEDAATDAAAQEWLMGALAELEP